MENAAAEFQKAASFDPSSVAAEQELRAVLEMIDDKMHAANAAAEPPPNNGEEELASVPAEVKPLSQAPINRKMTNDAKIVFDIRAPGGRIKGQPGAVAPPR